MNLLLFNLINKITINIQYLKKNYKKNKKKKKK